MPQIRISQLQSAANLNNSDFIPVVNNGVTRKTLLSSIVTLLSSPGSGSVFSPSSAVVIDVNTSNPALRVTQRGTGNALVVEDSTNPDYTPFIIDKFGRVVTGYNSPFGFSTPGPGLEELNYARFNIYCDRPNDDGLNESGININTSEQTSSSNNSRINLNRSRGTKYSPLPVNIEDRIGTIHAQGYTLNESGGGIYIPAAGMRFETDGIPSLSCVPGRITFYTGNSGIPHPYNNLEKMRITHDGKVGIGTTKPTELLTVAGNISASGTIKVGSIVTGDSSGISDFYVSANGNIGIGTESPNEKLTIVGNISAVSTTVVLTNLPTVSAGLPTGALYNSNGFLRIV